MGIQIDPVPSFELVILLSSARIEGALVRCLGFPQVLPDLGNEGLQVLNIFFAAELALTGRSSACLSRGILSIPMSWSRLGLTKAKGISPVLEWTCVLYAVVKRDRWLSHSAWCSAT